MLTVLQVCTGRAQPLLINGRKVRSAIGKRAVNGPVAVLPTGLEGDEQADPRVHGGAAKAVYAYPNEHRPFWQAARSRERPGLWDDEPLPPGFFGENLVLDGVLEDALWVGDRLVLPHCVLVVSEPRFPCFKFSAVMGFAGAGNLMVESGDCGAYLSVDEPGTVQAGEAARLVAGPRVLNIRAEFQRLMKKR